MLLHDIHEAEFNIFKRLLKGKKPKPKSTYKHGYVTPEWQKVKPQTPAMIAEGYEKKAKEAAKKKRNKAKEKRGNQYDVGEYRDFTPK